jgi:bacillopeptidase F
VNGAGTIVAVLDTGVDGNHPALHDRWRGNNGHPWQECWHDVLGTGTEFPTDPMSHGTHVMGTLTGLGVATLDSIGVAWGAEWIAANAINQGVGPGFDLDVIDCLQWFADPDGNPETVDDVPDVVQNSWGVNEQLGYGDCDMRWWAAIDNCEAAGVVMTWSVGGDGPSAGTVRSPADRATTATNCFSIGAVDASNFEFPYPLASFSSRGPSGCNVAAPLRFKPEVVAPGVEIYSSVPGGGYQVWSGTAMAGPHVAGVVALMRSAEPDLDVDTIKEILMLTARDEGPAGEDNAYGWGVIDAYEAVVDFAPVAVPLPDGATAVRLLSSRPNPFSRETTIRFRTPAEDVVTLTIHDGAGRTVRTLLSARLPAGEHAATWDSRNGSGRLLPAGVYFCRLRGRGFEEQRRLVLAK